MRKKEHMLDKATFATLVRPTVDTNEFANAPEDVREMVADMIEYEKGKKTFRANADYLDPLTFWTKHAL